MNKIFSTQRLGDLFGLSQGVTLGLVALVGIVLAAVIRKFHPFLPDTIPVSMQVLVYLGIGLLIVEFAAYWMIASSLTKGHIPSTAAGFGIALVMRLLLGLFIYLIVHTSGGIARQLLLDNITQLLILAIGVTVLLAPCRPLLESNFGTIPTKKRKPVPHPHPQQPQNRYAFKTAPRPATTTPQAPRPAPAATASVLAPPDYFVKQGAAKEVHGTITLPREVILKSVPEAAAYLEPGPQIRVKMAYFVPMIQYPSAWLTWEQLVEALDNRQAHQQQETDSHLHGRWVKIPARCFALQIPREYYDRTPKSRAWLKLPAVPQEAQFATQ